MGKSCKLNQLVSMYLSLNKRIAPSTADLTGRAFAELTDLAGDVDARDLTIDDAEIFQAYLVEKGLSKTTANIWCKSASPVFNWAIKKGWIDKNPFSGLRKFKIARRVVTVFSPEEIRRLLDFSDELWQARILLGLSTMRKGEVLNLTIRDIDFDKMMVRIQPKQRSVYNWAWQPKDFEVRLLPLIPAAVSVLLLLIEKMPAGQPYVCLSPQRYSYLMMKGNLSYRFCCQPDQGFDRKFRRICRRAAVNVGRTFHDLRRTGLTLLTDGLRLQEVREIAGHSSIKTTEAYLASRPDILTRASDLLKRGVAQFG